MNLQKGLKINLKRAVRLKGYTTFKIGGPADYLAWPKDRDELKILIKAAKRYKIPILVIGAGSNILADDKRVPALVVSLSRPCFKKLCVKNSSLYAGSSVMLSQLINISQKYGLSGLENLAGIPGTVGGVLLMNAGAWGRDIGNVTEEVEVMDSSGRIKFLKKSAIKFAYRKSGLRKYIILGARFNLTRASPGEIKDKIRLYIKRRRDTQDLTRPSAGCIFKNPAGENAGKLIDGCGLKERRIGGAIVSAKHANFILNAGNAKARDVLELMDLIKKEVRKKFGIDLKTEIVFLGEFNDKIPN